MSKGTPVYTLRIPAEVLNAVDLAVLSVNRNTRGEPYTRSSWILHAICEKLDHMERARKSRKRGRSARLADELDGGRPGAISARGGHPDQGEG